MNTQEAYDGIFTHFSQPGVQFGVADNGECCYRTEEGHRCALGCLIPDNLYDVDMEGNSSDQLLELWRDVCDDLFGEVDSSFLHRAQNAHDSAAQGGKPVAAFLRQLNREARDFGLTVRPL